MSVTLQNISKRMLVYQLPKCPTVSTSGLKWVSEQAVRIEQGKDGNMRRTKVKLRHAPVLRLSSGETRAGLPIEVLRDENIKRDLNCRPPLLKELSERPTGKTEPASAARVASSTRPAPSKRRSRRAKTTESAATEE
jgi:hypothetical protein